MRESKFQGNLIDEIESLFPDCEIWKNDANYRQGIPDLLILYRNKWAVLECKASLNEPYQPNQEYYLDKLGRMSFAAMICPENKEAVLYELQRAFKTRRTTRLSKC